MIPFLLYSFYILRYKYIASGRELKRLDAITRSPIYADFSASLEGLTTLRAYNLRYHFTQHFQLLIDKNGQAFFSFLMVSRWFGFRLDMICSLILIIVSFVSVLLRDSIDVGLIGFALVYTMSLSGLFQWTVRQSAEVEAQMTSIERISTYCNLLIEEGYSSTISNYSSLMNQENNIFNDDLNIPIDLELRNITIRYRNDLEPVLQDISCYIRQGQKIGVIGRTGSGKSSLLLALLRLNIISSGNIFIAKESLLDMSLERARSIISVIPQDPHLFKGTIRFNLDPFHKYSDLQVNLALQDAHIYDYIQSLPLQLVTLVDEGGKNFSVGQRQLLSLARCILRQSKIILMDEVTASIDYQTDRLIQSTIRTSEVLKRCTIITVAHRLRTIADADYIMCIHQGKLVEFDQPKVLLDNTKGYFYSLAIESNEYDDLKSIANNTNAN